MANPKIGAIAAQGGRARAEKLTPEQRRQAALRAVMTRWAGHTPQRQRGKYQDYSVTAIPDVITDTSGTLETPNRTLRFMVLTRDKFTCRYCGRKAPDVVLEADHVVPKSRGGRNTMDNLVAACFDCNRGKSYRRVEL